MTVEAETDLPTKPTARRVWIPLRRFGRSQGGATAVEFAIVATPFFILMAAILETTLMFWTNSVLEEAVSDSARVVLTGQAASVYRGTTAANTTAFKNAVCANAPGLIDCGKLSIDVRSYASFSAAQSGTSSSSPVSGGTLNASGFSYNQTQPGQVVVVRAVLEYRLLFTQWTSALANIGGGKRALLASTTFRTEPFTVPAT